MLRQLSCLIPLLAACGDDQAADGTITATVYGEAFIEEGIPADVFVDGWAVSFDTFLVSIGNVAAQAGEGAPEVGSGAFYLIDLAQPSAGAGYRLTTLIAPPGRYDHYGYQILPAPNALPLNLQPPDILAMTAAGYSIWIRGSATKDAETKTFDWGFPLELTYAHCDLQGSVDGNDLRAEATIHADHLFYDDAVSEEPDVAFQLIADADADDDGAVTLDELAALDLRGEARYQVGSLETPAGEPIINLRQYLEHQVVTLGHINGEGHCEDQLAAP